MRIKIFFSIIIFKLCIINFSQANDIKDFQVEGISIRDSALNFFSQKELEEKKKKGAIYSSDDYYSATFGNKIFFKTYDYVQLHLKKNDSKYTIYSVGGQKDYGQNRIEDCYKEQNEALTEIRKFFKSAKVVRENPIPWSHDKRSMVKSTYISLKSGDEIALQCYDHPVEIGMNDNLTIAIDDKEFVKWLYKN